MDRKGEGERGEWFRGEREGCKERKRGSGKDNEKERETDW